MNYILRNYRNPSGFGIACIMALPALLAGVRGYKYFSRLGPNSWESTDWYISNDFGFVRRGLLGGALRAVATSFDWFNVNLLTFLLTIIVVFTVSVLLIAKARNISYSTRLALAFSPAFYPVYFLWDPHGGGRKEVLAIVFVLAYLLIARAKGMIWNAARPWLVLLVLPLLTLAHEGIFFFSAPILIFAMVIDWINGDRTWSNGLSELLPLARSLALVIPAFFALFAAFVYSSPPVTQVEAICRSWQIAYESLTCIPLPSALQALAGTGSFGAEGESYFSFIARTYEKPFIYIQWLLAFGYVIVLIGACLIPLVECGLGRMSANIRCAIATIVVGACSIVAIFNAPLYAFAVDYGRWMSVSVTLILTCCLLYREQIVSAAVVLSPAFAHGSFPSFLLVRTKWATQALLFVSSFAIVPHCCVTFWRVNPLFGRAVKLIAAGLL